MAVSLLHAAGDVLLLELDGGDCDLADARDGELDSSVAVDGLGEEHGTHLRLYLGEERLDHLRDEHRVPDGGVPCLHYLLHVWLRVANLHIVDDVSFTVLVDGVVLSDGLGVAG